MTAFSLNHLYASQRAISLVKDEAIVDCNDKLVQLMKVNDKQQAINQQARIFSQNNFQTTLKECHKTGFETLEWSFSSNNDTYHFISTITIANLSDNHYFFIFTQDLTQEKIDEALKQQKFLDNEIEQKIIMEDNNASLKAALLSAEHMIITSTKANDAKTEFIANISHELRTPLHNILSFAQLGTDKTIADKNSSYHTYFDRITRGGKRLLNLVDNLLDLSTLEAGNTQLNRRLYDMETLFFLAKKELEINEKEVSVIFSEPDFETIVWIDPDKILKVIKHILTNAIQYSEKQGTINIYFKQATLLNQKNIESPAINLVIEDNGTGIPEKELNNIFDKFTQSSKTRSNAGGTGLGLAISKEIILLHQGNIFADSIEHGARFNIVLPTTRPD